MEPDEVAFLAERCPVTIVPHFTHDAIHLIGGGVGPFRAGMPLGGVPLWLAVALRRRRRCRVLAPAWLAAEPLAERLEAERRSRSFAEPPHERYVAVAKLLLLDGGGADRVAEVPRADEVRTLVKDVWDARASKLRTSAEALVRTGSAAGYGRLDRLTPMEIESARPLLPRAMDRLRALAANSSSHDLSRASFASSGGGGTGRIAD